MTGRSSFKVMSKLIIMVKPLLGVMLLAIFMGCIGFFCAALLTVSGGYAITEILQGNLDNINTILIFIGIITIMRGVFHYIEQYFNHYIAFKLLAIIRDKVFSALRKLAPAKLDGADRGNLVSVITSDIELLEVFYAHTISPICIAFITSAAVVVFVSGFHIALGMIVLISHIAVGVLIPLYISKNSKNSGELHRNSIGELNTYILDSFRGLREILQYDYINERKEEIGNLSNKCEKANSEIKNNASKTYSVTAFFILIFSLCMLFVSSSLYIQGSLDIGGVLIPTMMIFSSFGAVTATANLGAGLAQTMAAGNRVLDILEDVPVVCEVVNGKDVAFSGAEIDNITFSYDNQEILKDFSLEIQPRRILGIMGKSGCGKSTILKLLMRFWDVRDGAVKISGENIKEINTASLRENQSLVTQETHIFHDTIENNIKIANLHATHDEVVEACKKASVHEFIETLPKGYETEVGELGDTISGGEKQRIGIARAFLRDAPLILLDEPTGNLDSLNEGVILKSLKNIEDKSVVIVSHRKSTLKIADRIYNVKTGRVS